VTGPDGKPVFAALINVHVVYGFGGFHKLDLGVYTEHDGKAKFTGLPAKVRNPPLEFRAGKDNLAGIATVDAATTKTSAQATSTMSNRLRFLATMKATVITARIASAFTSNKPLTIRAIV